MMKTTTTQNAKGALYPSLLSWLLLSHSPPFARPPPSSSLITANQTRLSHPTPRSPQPPLSSANGTTVLPSAQASSFESCLLLPPPLFPVPGSTGMPILPLSIARIHLSSSFLLPLPEHHRLCQTMPPSVPLGTSGEALSLISFVYLSLSFSLPCESPTQSLCHPACFVLLKWFPRPSPLRWILVPLTLPALSTPSFLLVGPLLLSQFSFTPIYPCQGQHGQSCCLLYPEHGVLAFELLLTSSPFITWSLSQESQVLQL